MNIAICTFSNLKNLYLHIGTIKVGASSESRNLHSFKLEDLLKLTCSLLPNSVTYDTSDGEAIGNGNLVGISRELAPLTFILL